MGYDLLFQQAIKLHEQGRLDEAENIYRQILETAPTNPDVLNLLGLIAQAKGRHAQAVELFYQAVKKRARATRRFILIWDCPWKTTANLWKLSKHIRMLCALIPNLKKPATTLATYTTTWGIKTKRKKCISELWNLMLIIAFPEPIWLL